MLRALRDDPRHQGHRSARRLARRKPDRVRRGRESDAPLHGEEARRGLAGRRRGLGRLLALDVLAPDRGAADHRSPDPSASSSGWVWDKGVGRKVRHGRRLRRSRRARGPLLLASATLPAGRDPAPAGHQGRARARDRGHEGMYANFVGRWRRIARCRAKRVEATRAGPGVDRRGGERERAGGSHRRTPRRHSVARELAEIGPKDEARGGRVRRARVVPLAVRYPVDLDTVVRHRNGVPPSARFQSLAAARDVSRTTTRTSEEREAAFATTISCTCSSSFATTVAACACCRRTSCRARRDR